MMYLSQFDALPVLSFVSSWRIIPQPSIRLGWSSLIVRIDLNNISPPTEPSSVGAGTSLQ